MPQPAELPLRAVGEWTVRSTRPYENPFTDVAADATFTGPDGDVYSIPGFYDGDGTWRIRFSSGQAGRWSYRIEAYPTDPELAETGTFEVTDRPVRGFLRATPDDAWGFRYESGDPVFLLGDTMYNLIAETYLGNDIRPLLERRVAQGFNLIRMSLAVVSFCPPNAYPHWRDRRIWPWGGTSDVAPQFDRFDLDYFRAVDATVRMAAEVGIGLEMILEMGMPGNASPFCRRDLFTAEWEELWIRYLIARYDAYESVYFWTLMNEYEFYPLGEFRHTPTADRWAMRLGRYVRETSAHGHIVSVHNGPQQPPFAQRFRADPQAIDAIMYQTWGTTGEDDGWLAAGIEEALERALTGWPGSALLAEYGYETSPELAHIVPGHRFCDVDHTRRGAWRGAFSGFGVIHGFHNQWFGFGDYAKDQPGVAALGNLRKFLTEIVPCDELRPAVGLVDGPEEPGRRPLTLATRDRGTVAVYLPAGGAVRLTESYADISWYDPRTSNLVQASAQDQLESPGGGGARPYDWILLLRR